MQYIYMYIRTEYVIEKIWIVTFRFLFSLIHALSSFHNHFHYHFSYIRPCQMLKTNIINWSFLILNFVDFAHYMYIDKET